MALPASLENRRVVAFRAQVGCRLQVRLLLAIGFAVTLTTSAAAGTFSLTRNSPTAVAHGLSGADLLSADPLDYPTITIGGSVFGRIDAELMGLVPGDDIDAIYFRGPTGAGITPIFSVDSLAVGESGSGVRQRSIIGDQARFLYGNAFGKDSPPTNAVDPLTGPLIGLAHDDDVDGLELTPTSPPSAKTTNLNLPGAGIFFSLTPDSPSLAVGGALAGHSAGDIFRTTVGGTSGSPGPGVPILFLSHSQMGLSFNDDIDALDFAGLRGPGTGLPTPMISLAPGSAMIGTQPPASGEVITANTLFEVTNISTGTPEYMTVAVHGLLDTDNLNANSSIFGDMIVPEPSSLSLVVVFLGVALVVWRPRRRPVSRAAHFLPILVVALMADCASAGLIVARGGSRGDDVRKVEEQLRCALPRKPNDPYVIHELGSLQYRNGRRQAGEELWDRAAVRDANLPSTPVKRVFEALRANDIGKAHRLLAECQTERDRDPHVFLAEASIAMRESRIGDARAALQKAHSLNPRLHITHLSLGRFYEQIGRTEEARELFGKATRLDPTRAEGWRLLAGCHFRQDEFAQAHAALQQSAKFCPGEKPADVGMAHRFLAAGDLVSARRWLKRAVERQPDEHEVRFSLAHVLARLQRYEEAREELCVLAEQTQYVPALLLLAEVEEAMGQPQQAVRHLRRAIKLDPETLVARNNLAMLLMMLREAPEESLRHARACYRALPDDATVIGTYGCVLFQAGKLVEARRVLAEAVRRAPRDPWNRYAYGSLLADAEERSATLHLEGCLMLAPEFPRKAEVKDLLAKLK